MFAPQRRVQRREIHDYPSLLVLMDSLGEIDATTRRAFAYGNGEVWKRFNAASKGATRRRITLLFLSDERHMFEALLFVGCDFLKQRQHDFQALWSGHPLCASLSESALRRVCIDRPGRAVLMLKELLMDLPSDVTVSTCICPCTSMSPPMGLAIRASLQATAAALPA